MQVDSIGAHDPPFEQCVVEGCEAARFRHNVCLGHIDDSGFENSLSDEAIDARCAHLSSARLENLLRALGHDAVDSEQPADRTTGAQFRAVVRFDGATFVDDVNFANAEFHALVRFDGAVFAGNANFSNVTFHGHADFDRVDVTGTASFEQATFCDHAGFEDAYFADRVGFESANFDDSLDLRGAQFCETVRFTASTFAFPCELGPFVARDLIVFDRCIFRERVRVLASGAGFTASAASFARGALIRICRADMLFDDADFGRPSTIAHANPCHFQSDVDGDHPSKVDSIALSCQPPRLITINGAQIADVSLSGLDLTACRFFGAHGLASTSIEASCTWPASPRGRVRRELIMEECDKRGGRWLDATADKPRVGALAEGPPPTLTWGQISGVYRELRQAREEAKDQAGAGDLYYGEMEMRRRQAQDATRTWLGSINAERFVLGLYRWLSGYGLRASRALMALGLVLLGAVAVLRDAGFDPPVTTGQAALYAVESVSALVRPHVIRQHVLTYSGQVVVDMLRILGPLLIGLALLAVRARVKR